MTFTVVYDANVLFPSVLRDVLIHVARMGLNRARWSELILDEVFDSISKKQPGLDANKLARTRKLMCQAVPDCLVETQAIQTLVPALTLPDPDDRHVLAAAILAGAQVIVTTNLKDFPPDELTKFRIEAKHPDAFLQDIYHLDGALMHQAVSEAAAAYKNPPMTVGELVEHLDSKGLPISASLLRR
ncbi:PIN domain-containing protein [Mycobacterium riyadhense]|uniref:PIN domain-containing protein n=1 Tax=Mycobacterium riyadhense TaxID=486698 RepID=UPI00195E5977|nr:PIN domain-containing protein [Mycobacterium riyadhense]